MKYVKFFLKFYGNHGRETVPACQFITSVMRLDLVSAWIVTTLITVTLFIKSVCDGGYRIVVQNMAKDVKQKKEIVHLVSNMTVLIKYFEKIIFLQI